MLGQGTWKIRDTREVEDTLVRGFELGMTHIDTAELYEGAEEVVARVLRGRRDQAFVVSKVLPIHGSRRGTVEACERSLHKLGIERLDAYLLHWDGGEYPLSETMAGMKDLLAAGKIAAVGVSNFDVSQMVEAQQALGDTPLACNQVLYHLGDRSIEREILPWCEAHNAAVVGYSPFSSHAAFIEGTPEYAALAEVGRRHDKSVRQVALRFLTRKPSLFAIPKASTLAHVEENAAAQGFDFTRDDLAIIEEAFAEAT